jgi:hypothetical protein
LVTAALIERLGRLPNVTASEQDDGRVVVLLGGSAPDLVVDPAAVVVLEPLTTPWGAPALRMVRHDLAADGSDGVATVVVFEGDVIFAPDPTAGQERVVPGRLPHVVSDLPPVVSYHEVRKHLSAGADPDTDGDRLIALALAVTACVSGARRVGLDVRELDAELTDLIDRARSY